MPLMAPIWQRDMERGVLSAYKDRADLIHPMTEVMRSGPRPRNHSVCFLTRSFSDQPPLGALLRLKG